jgi:formylmethanofuran dehydrogenase subunit E
MKYKKEKCSVCNKIFLHIDKLFKNKKGYVCISCDEGEIKDDKRGNTS